MTQLPIHKVFFMHYIYVYIIISIICFGDSGKKEPADVLNDIGNMLANLTDELDAMLEEEKRQGLND